MPVSKARQPFSCDPGADRVERGAADVVLGRGSRSKDLRPRATLPTRRLRIPRHPMVGEWDTASGRTRITNPIMRTTLGKAAKLKLNPSHPGHN